MSDPTIKLNPSRPADIEFEVSVQGSDDTKPIVRIVMDGCDEYKCMFECQHVEGSKWTVKVPPLKHFSRTTVPFCVEVIVDGYFFQPAEGVVQLIEDPQVMFQPSASAKPAVTASFTVKQGDKQEEDEQVSRMVAPQYGGELSATNALLRPEYDPSREQGTVKNSDAEKRDQTINMDDLASHVKPGETTDPEPQKGLVPEIDAVGDEGDEEDFDPKRVAESIVMSTVGRIQPPTTKGSLFQRDPVTGKAIVRGIESPVQKAQKAEKAAKVREILQRT